MPGTTFAPLFIGGANPFNVIVDGVSAILGEKSGNTRSYWVKEDRVSLTALLALFVSSRVRGRVRTG